MTTPLDEDEFTELTDATFPRVDLVGKGANGVPRFLIAKQDASAGLLEADYVRGLIEKATPDTTEGPVTDATTRERVVMPNGITLNGSPADLASFIHKAALGAHADAPAEFYEQVVKAKYDADDLRRMAANGQAMDDESYPIGDVDDLDKAIHAVGRGGAEHDAIRRHVIKRAKALGKSSMIPDNWAADGSLNKPVSKEAPVTTVAKDLMDAAGDSTVLDDGMDGMDPTVPLAVPCDEDVPGDPTDPGSPAWEAIDAATAAKWLSIAARLKNALGILAEREMLEAASADPSDAENAWDLEDAQCAVDYVISTLAVFAAGEQAEADLGCEMAEMCKALAGFDAAPLAVIEGLAEVRKAGRVLSATNEAKIRDAAKALGDVLASLPSAPQADTVTKEKEAAMPATATAQAPATVAKTASPEEQARDAGPVNAGGTTGLGTGRATGPDAALPADGPQAALPGDVPGRAVIKSAHLPVVVYDRAGRQCIASRDAIRDPVAKADGDDAGKPKMQAVFDQDGGLIGVVDPAAITPVAGAAPAPAAGPGDAAPATAADDMQPQPPADAGTPADAVGKAAGENVITLSRDVLKSIARDAATDALQAQGAAHQEVVAKMAADNGELREELKVVKERLVTVENSPAAPGVFANGQVPPKDARPLPSQGQLRGQDAGTQPVDVTKAAGLKETLYNGSGPAQARAFHELEGMAITRLHQIRSGQHSPAAAG